MSRYPFVRDYYGQQRKVHRGFEKTARAAVDNQSATEEPVFKMYRRRYGRRRRSFKRSYGKKYYGRRPNAGRIALRKINKLERQREKKYIATVGASDVIPIGGAMQIVGFGPYMVQGDTDQTRDGSKITVKSLMMKFNVTCSSLEADGATVRIIVCYDRRPNGADAATGNVLLTNSYLAPYNTVGNDKGRFQIIADRLITFDTVQMQWNDTLFVKKNLNVIYDDDNFGDVRDLAKGNFLIIAGATNVADEVDVNFTWKFRYEDN